MRVLLAAVALVAAVGLVTWPGAMAAPVSPPTIPSQYYVEFTFTMPQMPGFSEAVSVWYDGEGEREAISYDGGWEAGMVTSYFVKGKAGERLFFQMEPRGSNPEDVHMRCSRSAFTSKPYMFSAFPAQLDQFVYSTSTEVDGVAADVYVLTNTTAGNFTFFVDAATGAPLLYEYIGFLSAAPGVGFANDLNPDWFRIEYAGYLPGAVNASAYAYPSMCDLAPPAATVAVHTPLQLAHRYGTAHPDAHAALYREFQAMHGAASRATGSAAQREAAFHESARTVRVLNLRSQRAHFALNPFADESPSDRMSRRMPRRSAAQLVSPRAEPYKPVTRSSAALPASWDWNEHPPVVGPLREQGDCGSCWAFGSTQAASSQLVLAQLAAGATNVSYVQLSEQVLMDCAFGPNDGCDGGAASFAYDGILEQGGWASNADYPYLMQNGRCHSAPATAKLSGHVAVTPLDAHAMQDAVVNLGPVAVAVDATDAWDFYAGGVLDAKCSAVLTDHIVVLEGYGSVGGADYWLLRNSWSQWWGVDGQVMLDRSGLGNKCGVLTAGVVPKIAL